MTFKRALCLLAFGLGILALDFFSKAAVYNHIMPYPFGGISVFKGLWGVDFSIEHVMNKGAAWGMFGEWQDQLLIARIGIIVALFVYLFFLNKDKSCEVALALISFGALGNVIDYFIYGHVVDMFHFTFFGYSYPVFNVADSAIFCGVMFFLLRSFFHKLRA